MRLQVFSCLCFSTYYLYKNDRLELFVLQKDPLLGWGPEAEVYQACRSGSNATLPVVTPVSQWLSSKSLPPESVTLITQLSLERMNMIRGQCKVWTDRIAAVVYVPVVDGFGAASSEIKAVNGSSLEEIVNILSEFHQMVESDDEGCALDLELVTESFSSWDSPELRLYPFNALRNRGLMLSRTEAVLLLDVDFLPSASLPESYQGKPRAFEALMQQLVENKTALVLPAFETKRTDALGAKIATMVSSNGKPHALSMWRKKEIMGFHMAQYKMGHGSTNFTRWLSSVASYPIRYRDGFEPYVVVARRYVPWYDERFRGYGRDKITHLAHMCNGLGVSLRVHPSSFVVHAPHPKAPTYRATKKMGQWDWLEDMYQIAKDDIKKGIFVPVTTFAKWCPRHILEGEVVEPMVMATKKGRPTKSKKTLNPKSKSKNVSSRRALLRMATHSMP